ncbi:MAG: glucosidase [Granulosicoccus sp.]|nr:glucosidase [Granulosicoccus sp.]
MAQPNRPRRTATAEQRRLKAYADQKSNWKLWGPYLAERAWGTVREDYSVDGNAWDHFTHDQAHLRAYRWNEDGLAGFCDENQSLCFSLALWNGKDAILKERLFGLSGPEGNHGEDVKEHYWYEDSTPTYSFASIRYHYPQTAFPYKQLRDQNAARGFKDSELELSDTGIFDQDRYFDIQVSYAKAAFDDLLITVRVQNLADRRAKLTVIPQLWFRNTWSWGYANGPLGNQTQMPVIKATGANSLCAEHPKTGCYQFYWQGKSTLMLTNNDTNLQVLYGRPNQSKFVKDAFHRYIIDGDKQAINPDQTGTKAGVSYAISLAAGASRTLQFRLCSQNQSRPFLGFKPIVNRRRLEADRFYSTVQSDNIDDDSRVVQRQALSGLLWSKQIYYYDVTQWLRGDPGQELQRKHKRNLHWRHMRNFDIMSMPDKWEYPWYAVWDTAFHTLPLALVDPVYAKSQLTLITQDRYMHPDGQLPAYEWAYGDVNPPVHAWAALSVYRIEEQCHGNADRDFLESIFHKLMLNFSWWVNQKGIKGQNLFAGGFLGLDNISLFDRSLSAPDDGVLIQSDGTAWMGFFCQNMLSIALTLAQNNPAYEPIASKFAIHYLRIAQAINGDHTQPGLWSHSDGFFYDRLDLPNGKMIPMAIRSLVGLMPLIAVNVLDHDTREKFPEFARQLDSFLAHNPEMADRNMLQDTGENPRLPMLSFVNQTQLRSLLAYLLDEDEFLSDFGIRSLSRIHQQHPFTWTAESGRHYQIAYEPGESETDLFGGNSNWRGPIWFPINYLLIEALYRYHNYFGEQLTIECPTGSGQWRQLDAVAAFLSQRLVSLFEANKDGAYPWCGDNAILQRAASNGLHQFFEYFHGETGQGLGASHQTGWTGLVALLQQKGSIKAS